MKKHQRKDTILRLFEAIQLRGLENLSVLAETAGIPLESARYMVWHELPKHFIAYEVEIDYEALGLGRWIMEFTPGTANNGVLGGDAGVIYSARVIPANSNFSVLAIPRGCHYELLSQMEHLVKTGAIKNYSLREIQSTRNVSFNASFYNFRESRWGFTWKNVEKYQRELRANSFAEFPEKKNTSLAFDYKDLLILREFQKMIPRSISKLGRRLEIDQHNIRYHYNRHARSAILGYRLKVIPEKPKTRSAFLFRFSQANGDALGEARSIALSLPFTESEWSTTDREYCWSASCPGEYANEFLRFTSSKLSQIRGNLRFLTLDSASEFRGTIPYQFYDERCQKWNYSPEISPNKPYANFHLLKDMCKYEVERLCLVNETSPKNCAITSCSFASH